MYRSIEDELFAWKDQVNRKPLLLRGARQVGKSYVVEKFGRKNFANTIVINFELEPRFSSCFSQLEPTKIINSIEILTQQSIQAGKSLLFLDEIQQCPEAIQSLRYFKEKLPQLHVIAAGSFLEFVINNEQYQQPVGRVQSMYMHPCSFREFLLACGDHKLVDYLANVSIENPVELAIHDLLLERCREYFILGGMPEIVDFYVKNNKFYGCERLHATLFEYYFRDLAKYAQKINSTILEKIFSKAPGLVAKHFKYTDIDPEIKSRDQKPALEALVNAGIIHKVHLTSANGLPLLMGQNDKKFKLIHLDLGLVKYATGLDLEPLLSENLILLNQGALAEQFVAQELLAYAPCYKQTQLFYWERDKRGSQAEVDYVINIGPRIIPIEVKSGKTGRLKSIQQFLDEKGLDLGVRISQNQFQFSKRILTIPMYLIHELPRLIQEFE